MFFGVIFIITSSMTPAQVHEHAHIPVLVPSVVQAEVKRAYESVDSATPHAYSISFGWVPKCKANACDIGYVTGGVSEDLAATDAEHVHLRDGTAATYLPYHCGASCAEARIGFWWHHVLYVLHLKSATRSEMIRSANSMLP